MNNSKDIIEAGALRSVVSLTVTTIAFSFSRPWPTIMNYELSHE